LFNIVRTIKTVATRTVVKDWSRPQKTYWWSFCVVLIVLFVGTISTLKDFPWNGNPVDWYNANTKFEEGRTALNRREPTIAMSKVKEAIRMYPGDKRFHAELAKQWTHQNALPEAIEAWEHCLKLDQNQIDAWISLSQLQLVQGDLTKAHKAIDRALNIDETAADAHALKALVLQGENKANEAQQEFAKTEKLNREGARFWNFAGSYYAQQGKMQEAEVALRQATDIEPTNALYQNSLGHFYLQQKKYDLAEVFLNRAAKLDSENSQYWMALAQAAYGNHNNKLALTALTKASALKPSDWRRLEQLGTLQMAEKEYAGAVDTFRRATEIVPKHNVVWDALIKALFLSERYAEAKVATIRFMNLSPENQANPVAWQYLGQLLQKEGAASDAKNAYKRAIELSKNAKLTAFCNTRLAELNKGNGATQ
jgi:tetratricopeptide (TPR) repeat protein